MRTRIKRLHIRSVTLMLMIMLIGAELARAEGVFARGETIKDFLESKETAGQSMGIGYVLGVYNGHYSGMETGHEQARLSRERHLALVNQYICVGESVTVEQIVAVARVYFRNHPEKWHLPADISVINAIREAWPCKLGAAK